MCRDLLIVVVAFCGQLVDMSFNIADKLAGVLQTLGFSFCGYQAIICSEGDLRVDNDRPVFRKPQDDIRFLYASVFILESKFPPLRNVVAPFLKSCSR